jgi:histidinol-phosphate aminotransferase
MNIDDDLGPLRDRVPVALRAAAPYHVPKPATIRAKLDANEFPYPWPDDLRHELGRVLSHVALERYPDSSITDLRRHLADDLQVDSDHIVFGNGSDELISIIVNAFAGAICFPTPTFVFYRMAAQARGVATVEVPLDQHFELDEPAMLSAVERYQPSVVFLALPNNPTGTLWRPDFAVELAARFPATLVVADEAYGVYSGSSLMAQVRSHRNLVVMRTLSKIGMAGARLGYAVASRAVAAVLETVRPPYNVSSLDQTAALFALQHAQRWLGGMIEEICQQRSLLATKLASLPGMEVFSSAANLLLVRYLPEGKAGHASQLWQQLCDRGIVVRNFDTPGATALAGCLRVTIGTPDENLLLLTSMRELLAT